MLYEIGHWPLVDKLVHRPEGVYKVVNAEKPLGLW